jgi:hypothetical protein
MGKVAEAVWISMELQALKAQVLDNPRKARADVTVMNRLTKLTAQLDALTK